MRKIAATLGFASVLWISAAAAQVPQFPQTLPQNTVVGRTGIGSGPAQAIPFSQLSTLVFAPTFGGCTALSVPTQATPQTSLMPLCGLYADSGAGNIFQFSSWADNTGTRPTVAVFGQARAMGTNSLAWGGNFVGYTNAAGAFAQGIEVDFGVLTGSSQEANGIDINVGGVTNSNLVIGLSFDQLSSIATMQDAIRFSNFAGGQPFTHALIYAPNSSVPLTTPYGINLANANFGTAAIATKNFTVGPVGQITSGAAGNGGSLTLNGSTSGSAALTVGATGGGLSTSGSLGVGTNLAVTTTIASGANGGTGGALQLNGATSSSVTLSAGSTGGAFINTSLGIGTGLTVGNNGGTAGSAQLNGSTSGAASITASATGGHLHHSSSSTPSLTAGCNGTGSSVVGTDLVGLAGNQTAVATSCTLTFGTAYAAAPRCIAAGNTGPLTSYSTTTTALTVNFASTANFLFTYFCDGA